MTKTTQTDTEARFTEKGGLELTQTTTKTYSFFRGLVQISTWSSKPVSL